MGLQGRWVGRGIWVVADGEGRRKQIYIAKGMEGNGREGGEGKKGNGREGTEGRRQSLAMPM